MAGARQRREYATAVSVVEETVGGATADASKAAGHGISRRQMIRDGDDGSCVNHNHCPRYRSGGRSPPFFEGEINVKVESMKCSPVPGLAYLRCDGWNSKRPMFVRPNSNKVCLIVKI